MLNAIYPGKSHIDHFLSEKNRFLTEDCGARITRNHEVRIFAFLNQKATLPGTSKTPLTLGKFNADNYAESDAWKNRWEHKIFSITTLNCDAIPDIRRVSSSLFF